MTLVFLHIDKAGGMTLRNWLAAHYSAEHIRPVPSPPALSSAGDLTYPTVAMDLFKQNRRFIFNPQHQLVMGHYDYGIVQRIPAPKTVMTVLREPVQRVVSLYQFIGREGPVFHQLTVDAHQLGLAGWVRRHVGLWENAMTRQLAGVRWSSSIWHAASETIYAQAERNLQLCDYVGVTERLDDFIHILSTSFGWALPQRDQQRLNASKYRIKADDDTTEFIRQHSTYDSRLYQAAKQRFEHDIQQSFKSE